MFDFCLEASRGFSLFGHYCWKARTPWTVALLTMVCFVTLHHSGSRSNSEVEGTTWVPGYSSSSLDASLENWSCQESPESKALPMFLYSRQEAANLYFLRDHNTVCSCGPLLPDKATFHFIHRKVLSIFEDFWAPESWYLPSCRSFWDRAGNITHWRPRLPTHSWITQLFMQINAMTEQLLNIKYTVPHKSLFPIACCWAELTHEMSLEN